MQLRITLILLTAFIFSAGCGCGASRSEVQRMGHTIDRELPLGSTEIQVAKFLDDRKLVHDKPMVIPDDPLPRHRNLRRTGATIENFWHSEPSMYISFYFDNGGKLVETTVRNACGLGCYSIRSIKTSDKSAEGVFSDSCE